VREKKRTERERKKEPDEKENKKRTGRERRKEPDV
jgi:hypothetical protein